jgi:ABC-type multidrug transport system fused ATPase/permease subunit
MKKPVLYRFVKYIKPVKYYYIGAVFCGIYKMTIPVVNAYVFGQVIEALTAVNLTSEERYHRILVNCTIALCVCLLGPAFVYFRSMFALKATLTVINNMRIDLFHHVQKLSHSFFAKNKAGTIASRIISDTTTTKQFLSQVVINSGINIGTVTIVITYLIYQNWILGLLTISLLPFQMYMTAYFGKRIKENSKEVQSQSAALSGNTTETLNNISVVKMFTAENEERNRFSEHTGAIVEASLKAGRLQALNQVVNSLAVGIAPLLVIAIGSYFSLYMTNSVTPGLLVTFVLLQSRVYDPIIVMTELLPAVAEATAAMERIYELLDAEPDVKSPAKAIKPLDLPGEIIFDNVSFAYAKKLIIKDLSIKIEKNKTTAFVGSSGSGKSTITYLIPRFYDVVKGKITINNYDITTLNLRHLRSSIGIVPQEPMLFSGTILNNISYGRPTASHEEIIHAAKLAYADKFIEAMPGGYETIIGERGVSLSGGQKQRIAIARAFLKNPPILILDEATSALDTESESEVQNALNTLMSNRTTIVIAHRLSTIKNADKILVFDEGQVIESGTHQELLDLGGKYASLSNLSSLQSVT